MKQLLLAALASLPLLQSCSQANSYSGSSYAERPKTAEELRAELLATEQAAPADYLAVSGTYRRNLLNQLVLEGDVASSATLASYKDPMLLVTWYSKTRTEIATQQYPVYEFLRPQRSTHFKLKTNAPDEVASVAMGIAGATPTE